MILLCQLLTLSLKQFPLRETSTKAFGRLILHQIQCEPSSSTAHLDILSSLASALHDDSSEVRRRALSAIKAVAKVCIEAFVILY
jgi:hypothetical protein